MSERFERFAQAFSGVLESKAPALAVSSFTGSAAAFAATSLSCCRPAPACTLVVTPGIPEADLLMADLAVLENETPVRALEFPPPLVDEPATTAARLRVAAVLDAYAIRPYPLVLVAPAGALAAPVPRAAAVSAATIRFVAGERGVGFEDSTARLAKTGYSRVPEVSAPGDYAVRGGILDVWPPDAAAPVRAEFFGEELESLRTFDAATQVSTGTLESIDITPVELAALPAESITILDALPPGSSALFLEHNAYSTLIPADRPAIAFSLYTGDPAPARVPTARFLSVPLPGFSELGADAARHPELLDAARARLKRHLAAARQSGALVSEDESLSGGFEVPGLLLVTKGDRAFAGRRRLLPARRAAISGARLTDVADLEIGEYVVHLDYGVGKFLGSTEVNVDGRRSEVFTLEYADGAKLHVPVAHAHLLSRYVGVRGEQVHLHRLDGKRWVREKVAAQRAVADLAAALLETQARRAVVPGFACDVRTEGIEAFEAAFPYEETPDQAKAIDDVKADLALAKPMDRLICGDAGYGKTEVAMRAAFIMAMNGRQTALLAPTTVLAEQHFETFLARFEGTPVRIEALSRFQTPRAREGTRARLASGATDIVVGTHAILSERVAFHDLGLVIVDEEQRFGVRDKERLKRVRETADVLAMSATPIPRTLYLSMTGARDLSVLKTPPRERVAVETKVIRDDDAVVRDAIRRELARGGQIYFLHNRVRTLDRVEARLRALAPDARIVVAHGQMPAAELADRMRRFEQGRADILLSTTIVEAGLDIPRANTILVDHADRFGIAELYQLRGRVGRGARQGWAYFLLPPEGLVDSDARERLSALQKHTGLGAGFGLALRDLEIRGAGNLLGSEQSGHIAAVGFSLYCQLLQRTIAQMKGEKVADIVDVSINVDFLDFSPGDASDADGVSLPYDYVEDEAPRVEFHKRLASCSNRGDVRKLKGELADRYGKLPPAAQRLIRMAEFRVLCAEAGIARLDVKDGRAIFYCQGAQNPSYVATISGRTADRKIDSLFKMLPAARAAHN